MWIDIPHFHAQHNPERTALFLHEENRRISYAALEQLACGWATLLAQEGVGFGDRVALLASNCLEHITIFFGCTKLGAIFVPLNFRLSQHELEAQLAQLEPALFFGRGPKSLRCHAPYRDLDHVVCPEVTGFQGRVIRDDDTLLMLFTSGSSGQPKGVMLHARMLLWNMINTHLGWGLRQEDVSVVHMPFFHTGGYNVTLLPLLRLGGTLILVNKFDPAEMLALIARKRVSVFFAVPTMFRMMQEDPGFPQSDLSSVRFCISGGAPCPTTLINAYRHKGVPMKQGFGLTEVGPNCFYMSDEDAVSRPDSVGKPMMYLQASLRDRDGQPVPSGEVGELCLAGPVVCGGYWGMPDAFALACTEGFFRTGDLMRADAHGFFYVIGRKKEMYISGGENVYPGEVVGQILRHPGIQEAQVIAVPDDKWGEVGFAFVRGEPLSLGDLRAFLNPLLSRYKHPHHLMVLPSFPLLENNKVDMSALKALALQELTRG